MSATKNKGVLVPYVKAPVLIETRSSSKRNRRRNDRRKQNVNPNLPNIPKGLDATSKGFINTLNDPFEASPVPLGLGTMINTTCVTAFVRTTATANADGSFAVVLNPIFVKRAASSLNGAFLSFNNAALATSGTWTSVYDATNKTAIAATFDQLRCLGAGLRVTPLVASTSVPGLLTCGSIAPDGSGNIPGTTYNNWSTANLINFPPMEQFKGDAAAQCCWRPSEITDFDFHDCGEVLTSINTTNDTLPVIVICGSGFPASTSVQLDAICHYEGYASTLSGATVSGGMAPSSVNKPPSLDSLWQRAKNYILPAAESAVSYLGKMGMDYLSGYFPLSSGIRAASGMFNHTSGRALPDVRERKQDHEPSNVNLGSFPNSFPSSLSSTPQPSSQSGPSRDAQASQEYFRPGLSNPR